MRNQSTVLTSLSTGDCTVQFKVPCDPLQTSVNRELKNVNKLFFTGKKKMVLMKILLKLVFFLGKRLFFPL